MRHQIRNEITSIKPFDEIEQAQIADVCAWIDSGAELCRLEKPATPNKHLVSYFVVVDGEHVLLVDHKNAQLWLPTGGHVEPGEHPRQTVAREAAEELGLDTGLPACGPLFLTTAVTVGLTAGHTDVSLWYVVQGNRNEPIQFDVNEFHSARWFHFSEVPLGRSDPHMGRFLRKLALTSRHTETSSVELQA